MKIVFIIAILFSILLGIIFLLGLYLLLPLFLIIIFPIGLYLLSYKFKVKGIIKSIVIVGFLLFSFVVSFSILVYETLSDVNSTWRYKGIIKNYENNILFEHFPKKIPNNAENIKFSYFGGFLQGGGFNFLKIKVDSNIYTKAYNLFESKKIINPDLPIDSLKGYPNYRYIDENIDEYETMILYSQPYKASSEGHHWNHGKVSGIGFNDNTYEIIYWADFW